MLTEVQARSAVDRCWGTVLESLAALPDDGWSGPTRCAGWTVLDLARHGAWGTSMEADALRRARVGEPGTAVGVEPDGGPAAVFAALRTSVADLVSELGRTSVGEGTLVIPFGEIPAAFGLQVFAMEAGVHADDVASALGREEPLGPDVVAATVAVLPAVFPVLASMAGQVGPEGTVVALQGPTVDLRFAVVDGAWAASDLPPTVSVRSDSDTGVLRFALGRIGTDAPGLTVDEGARPFKTWFPGP
ncbi:maleylpyruvate isomerase family mycothiol-dependent enzyme [Actinomycetospora termitidis]|uniref:Maleylpyruvate isomerase family mycothiol-dependent enzyme n=1 Tax=Actinomycetospora termitidis TaxID=3053470 RepID=A0ABT7MHR8_9PSEU|nr:maleylpyruvate isomerase family mycothiol-dependent enzyme [Actinomycetospora sp. Odt1-22]MDL5160225.1 maleylpyruvate isomerase family mycothiol-dependent enzyme [Actinomycetospora sp. Odt1-22]